ncbi:hypothetical protein DLREEDagrD3_04470 [Denitratisoma sp. agr-D3]
MLIPGFALLFVLWFAPLLAARAEPPSAPANAVVSGRGSALIRNGDLALARWQATADALKNALESQGATVRGGTLVSNGNVFETLSVRTDARTRDVQVLEEYRQGDQLFISLQATLEPATATVACPVSYRKRVLFVPMPLQHPEQLKGGEPANFPALLARRLAAGMTGDNATWLVDNAAPPVVGGDGRINAAALGALFERHRAQAVVAGVVRGFAPAEGAWSLLPGTERTLDLELMVFTLLADAPQSSRRFRFRLPAAAAFGPALSQALAEAGRWLQDEVACQPFAVRVNWTEGTRVGLAAGKDAGLREGDGLVLLRPGRNGMLALPLASATVRVVEADQASAEASTRSGELGVQAGDVAVSR